MKPIDRLGMGPTRRMTETGGGFRITVTPPDWSGIKQEKSVDLTPDQYRRYIAWMTEGVLIQDALPDLSPAAREVLLNGT